VKDNELALSVASQLNERYFLGNQLSDVIIAVSEKAKGKKMSPQASTQILTETIAQFNLPTKTDARKAVERQLRQELKLGPEPGTSVQAYIQEYTDSTRAKYQAAVNAIQALPVDATQDQVDKILQPFIDAANQYGPSLSAKIRRFEPRFHNSGMETAEAEAMAAAGQLLELIQGAKPQARPSYAQPVVATAPDESGNVVEQEFYRILPDQAKELGIPAGIYSIDPQTRREDELLQYEVRSVTGDLYFPELADNNIDRIRKEVAELIATDNANKGRTPAPPVARSVTSDGVPIVEGAGFFQKDGQKVAISRAYAPLLGVSDSQAFIMLWN